MLRDEGRRMKYEGVEVGRRRGKGGGVREMGVRVEG